MTSSIYNGTVIHKRFKPKTHFFKYSVFSLLIDLSELNYLDKTIKMNVRLKNELNVDSRGYWKNTHKALQKISERLVKLATKVGSLK